MPNPCPFCGAAVDRAKYVSMVSGGKTRTRHAESQLAKVYLDLNVIIVDYNYNIAIMILNDT